MSDATAAHLIASRSRPSLPLLPPFVPPSPEATPIVVAVEGAHPYRGDSLVTTTSQVEQLTLWARARRAWRSLLRGKNVPKKEG